MTHDGELVWVTDNICYKKITDYIADFDIEVPRRLYYYRTEDEDLHGSFDTLQDAELASLRYAAKVVESWPMCYCCGGDGCMACHQLGYIAPPDKMDMVSSLMTKLGKI